MLMVEGNKDELRKPLLKLVKKLREEVDKQFGDLVEQYSKKVADGVDKRMMFFIEERDEGFELMMSDDIERLSSLPVFSFEKQFGEVAEAVKKQFEEDGVDFEKIEFT